MRAPVRGGRWSKRFTPLLAGVVVALVAGTALTVVHGAPRPVVPAPAAIAASRADPVVERALLGSGWNRVSVSPLDRSLERVAFWKGSQVVVEVAVNAHRQVVQEQDFSRAKVPYGDWLAYQPALLIGLSLVFGLVTLVTPWRRMRNLDALVALSLLVSVVLFQHRYVNSSLLAAAPVLAYLAARCAWRALGPGRAAAPSTPLLTALATRAGPTGRIRWLRVTLGVVTLIFVMVGISSPFPVDVTYAVMEGATALIHGALPYGHMPPGILHGDTYPILSYALYTPLALIGPVRAQWDSVDGALAVAVLAALLAAWSALRSVAGQRVRRSPEAEEAGLRAALAVLTFPAVLITASTGTTDIVLAAMLGAALLLWRRPAAAAATLALAGWFKLAPFGLVPVLLAPLRGRRLAAALGVFGAISAAVLLLVVALGGAHGPGEMIRAVEFQFVRGSLQSVWSALGIESVQPLAQAGVLGLMAAATARLWREPGLASDPGRIAALSAALLIALQLAANYWAFLYLAWVVPLLSVGLLGPGENVHRRLALVPARPASTVPAVAA
jgi:Glycosyltransferase family 87